MLEKIVPVRFTAEQDELLKRASEQDGVTVSDFVRGAVEASLMARPHPWPWEDRLAASRLADGSMFQGGGEMRAASVPKATVFPGADFGDFVAGLFPKAKPAVRMIDRGGCQVHDLLEHRCDRTGIVSQWRVLGVFLGSVGVESLVQIECVSRRPGGDADSVAETMMVPEAMTRGLTIVRRREV